MTQRRPLAFRLWPGFQLLPARIWTLPMLWLPAVLPTPSPTEAGSSEEAASPAAAAVVEARIDGLLCTACAARSQAALLAVPGVLAATVDLDRGTARLHVDPQTPPTHGALTAAIDQIVVLPRGRRIAAAIATTAGRGARVVRRLGSTRLARLMPPNRKRTTTTTEETETRR